jgi:hypothetical protein
MTLDGAECSDCTRGAARLRRVHRIRVANRPALCVTLRDVATAVDVGVALSRELGVGGQQSGGCYVDGCCWPELCRDGCFVRCDSQRGPQICQCQWPVKIQAITRATTVLFEVSRSRTLAFTIRQQLCLPALCSA